MSKNIKTAIVGTVGIPASYGGFETLSENLVKFFKDRDGHEIVVYCSGLERKFNLATYFGARLVYIPLRANGPQSVLYDAISMMAALWHRADCILILGVSGCWFLPFIRLVSRTRVVTNIDGMEWRREKWGAGARFVLRFSEKMAVRYSHAVISDNQAISDYIKGEYSVYSEVIPYGGDHAVDCEPESVDYMELPADYFLALCRIEPENNVSKILQSFSQVRERNIVFIGNWGASDYGRDLLEKYRDYDNITLMDPIYSPSKLKAIRSNAVAYIHGHSAGGTNPALVEMMHFGVPVVAYDCVYNRFTTKDKAQYFASISDLVDILTSDEMLRGAGDMKDIAERDYTWSRIGLQYGRLIERLCGMGESSQNTSPPP